ncbi:hypothetical protein F6W70_09665 [Microbacterium maritypicum]|uniref:Uncharacterized protein n=1 Tax=Microbacterium maritypicum TaxID=33918 RepID=A0AAD3X5U1_MICMQ|nr:hypothetical protein [Microbacterium liquefaciens]KAB1887623.1 hypothetical protein F6W70_09665 [Microbacterium liquefaciens]
MPVDDDSLERLTRKLAPARIRDTLMFSALLQLVHELIKQSVLADVKGFFGFSDLFGEGEWIDAASKRNYEATVLSLAPGKPFDASALWLQHAEAITPEQRHRLTEIYAHRHHLTHGLAGFIVDVNREPDATILTDALQIAAAIDGFWKGVEKDLGSFDGHGDVDIEQVHSGRALLLQLCVDAYLRHDEPPDA